MSEIVVSKFGGTSVADFDAMNRSADIVLSDANVRLVVLSASAGITNLLVALAEGLEPGERFEKLDAIRNIQFAILERLRYPNVIREEIERLLENITVLAEAAALAVLPQAARVAVQARASTKAAAFFIVLRFIFQCSFLFFGWISNLLRKLYITARTLRTTKGK